MGTCSRWAWIGVFLLLAGCMQPTNPPAARKERPPEREEKPQTEPPQVVEQDPVIERPDGDASDADVQAAVMKFIDQVDGAMQRARERTSTAPTGESDARQVADEKTTPAEPAEPRVRIIPGDPNTPATAPQAAEPETDPGESPSSPPVDEPDPNTPPELADVEVRAQYDDATRFNPPQPAGINQPVEARNGPTSLAELLEQSPIGEDATFREQLDRRLVWVVAGEYEQARAPLTMVTEAQQALATRFIESLIAIREGNLAGDEAAAATTAAREIEALQQALRRVADLSVPTLKICSAVYHFGQYDLVDPPRFPAGTASEFVLYCEVRDFVSEHRDDGYYYTVFDMTTTVLDRTGERVLELIDEDITDRCRNRRHDCFIPRLVRLPASLSPGQYVAKVTLVDKLGQKVAENRVAFEIVSGH